MVDKKSNKEATHVLHQAFKVLEFTMELAVQYMLKTTMGSLSQFGNNQNGR